MTTPQFFGKRASSVTKAWRTYCTTVYTTVKCKYSNVTSSLASPVYVPWGYPGKSICVFNLTVLKVQIPRLVTVS